MTTNEVKHPSANTPRLAVLAALLVAALATSSTYGLSAATPPTEHEVKAAFVYNFAKFVDFPPNAFASSDSPITVGVIGDTQLADILEKLVKGKTANGRKLEVKRFSKTRQCRSCRILVVGPVRDDRVLDILEKVKAAGILTVGETDGFARHGGIIGFVAGGTKVAFEINVSVAKREGIRISSKLLGLAKAVIE